MKNIWIVLLAFALFACNSAPKAEEAKESKNTTEHVADWVEVTLDVEGMTCDGCENAINAGLESMDGIESVESSHEEAWTKVKFDQSQSSVEEITAKINDTGYKVKGEKGAES